MRQGQNYLENIAIILLQPKYAANVGAAARAALNMGISRLHVVGSALDAESVARSATHNAAHLVAAIEYHDDLQQALAGYSMVVGTTARRGRLRQTSVLPRQIAAGIEPFLAGGAKVGVLFGPEDKGLSNEALKYCGLITTIPTAGFSSLNLAQAVAIICYEIFVTCSGQPFEEALVHTRRPATVAETEPMYTAAQDLCRKLDALTGKELATRRLHALRQLVARAVVSAREAKLIKDACRNLSQLIGN